MKGNLPEIVNPSGPGGTTIRYQEYLGDILTSPIAGAFHIDTYLLNAANTETFPWLSQIAMNYEQYELEGVIFEFRSTSADALNSVNTALGSVIIATQYDVSDNIFNSKMEMLNYQFATCCKPSQSTMHMIECDPRQTTINDLYTLNGSTPAGTDPRLYHLGRTSIATTGFQGTNINIGQLHVTYQVKLLKPKLAVTLGNAVMYWTGQQLTYANITPLGTPATWFNVGTNIPQLSLLANWIVLPRVESVQYYRVEIVWAGAACIPVLPALIYAGCTETQNQFSFTPALAGQTRCSMIFSVKTSGQDEPTFIEFGPGGTLPLGGFVELRIIKLNPASGGA